MGTGNSEPMKKLISIITFLILFYVLPLASQSELLAAWPVITLAFICSVLFATQPALSVKESRANNSTDGWTIWLILGVSGIGQIISLIDWAYFRGAPLALDAWAASGVFLLFVGTIFRLWAIRTLDKAFSATVQIKEGQQLVTTGPYRWLRHPSYTGAWVAMIGAAMLMHSYLGLAIMGPGMLLVYIRRIAIEERTLEEGFREDYLKMKKKTWRMVPGW